MYVRATIGLLRLPVVPGVHEMHSYFIYCHRTFIRTLPVSDFQTKVSIFGYLIFHPSDGCPIWIPVSCRSSIVRVIRDGSLPGTKFVVLRSSMYSVCTYVWDRTIYLLSCCCLRTTAVLHIVLISLTVVVLVLWCCCVCWFVCVARALQQ